MPHSMIFGHLPVMGQYGKSLPTDANFLHLQLWIGRNYKKLFPEADEVPPVVYFDLWPLFKQPLAFVFDVDMARQLTQTSLLERSLFQKNLFRTLTGNRDLFSMEGQAWKTWRGRFNPAFSIGRITAMVPEMIDEVEIFTQSLEQEIGVNGHWGSVFPLATKTTSLTLDVIVRALLDKRLHEQTTPDGSPLRSGLVDTLRLGVQTGSISAFGRYHKIHKIAAYQRQLAQHSKAMDDYLSPPIEDIVNSSEARSQKKTIVKLAWDFVTGEKGDQVATLRGPAFVDFMSDHIKLFLFAGYDTTATTICWMFKLLQDNPECMARLRAEHDEVLGSNAGNVAETLRQAPQLLNSLPYTNAVIKETLRLKAPASTQREGKPGFFLTAAGDGATKYPTENFTVDDGAVWLHFDPRLWVRPEEFLPQRWLVNKHDPLYPPSHAWRPFGLGARACIGQELALTEVRLVAAFVARRFDIEEAWDAWDKTKGDDYPKHTINGERLYPSGIGPAHLKDDMPVHIRLRTR